MHALPPNLRNLLRRRSRLSVFSPWAELVTTSATSFLDFEVVELRGVGTLACMELTCDFRRVLKPANILRDQTESDAEFTVIMDVGLARHI
jgi:hypothetical protein